ncbi:hypothetical protein SAMN02745775_10471 [Falsiroseomonas stagni DSM 19981]|uniref:Uncharacterized protein n=2 Tax=Falsiroseomonas TaxID=2870713 RepID=A0A1I4AQ75_9PROT|nr:hypothetical protein SAMN02745775_10471 [Falsiroseomonas stagni DSM 19981]
MRILWLPYTLPVGLIGRYPWQTVALCTALTAACALFGHPGYGAWAAMLGSIVMIWLAERGRPAPIQLATAAGD